MWKADFWFRRIGSRDPVVACGSVASFGTMPDIEVFTGQPATGPSKIRL
jgi:hypothetical protein